VVSGDRGVNCSGTYNLVPGRLRNGGPCYTREGGTGAIYYDGLYWKICQAGTGPEESGWNFSQSGVCTAVPLGSWDASKRKMSESTRDYSTLSLDRGGEGAVQITSGRRVVTVEGGGKGKGVERGRGRGGFDLASTMGADEGTTLSFWSRPFTDAGMPKLEEGEGAGSAERAGLEGAGISEEERQVALAIAASLEGAGGGATSTARAAASPAIPEAIETRALAKADLIALEARALAKPFGTVPLMTALDDKSPLASGAKRYYYSSSVADSSRTFTCLCLWH